MKDKLALCLTSRHEYEVTQSVLWSAIKLPFDGTWSGSRGDGEGASSTGSLLEKCIWSWNLRRVKGQCDPDWVKRVDILEEGHPSGEGDIYSHIRGVETISAFLETLGSLEEFR
jgi:hypothetical protein